MIFSTTKRVIGFLLFFLLVGHVAQAQSQLDALLDKRLSKAGNDEARLDVYLFIIDSLYQQGEYKQARELYLKGVKALEKEKNKEIAGQYYFGMARLFYSVNFDSSLYFFHRSLPLLKEGDDKQSLASACNELGLLYKNKAEYDSAARFFQQALTIYQQNEDTVGLANVLNNFGLIFARKGDNAKAIEYYLNSLKLREEVGDVRGVAISYGSLGNLYRAEGNYDKAIMSYKAALEDFKKLGEYNFAGIAYHNIGKTYKDLNNYDSAKHYYYRARGIFADNNFKQGLAQIEDNLGEILMNLGELDSAIVHMKVSMDLFSELGDPSAVGREHQSLANALIERGYYEEARLHLEESIRIAKQSGEMPARLNAYFHLSNLYAKQNEHAKALDFFRRYDALKDTLEDSQQREAIADLQLKYDTEKREAEFARSEEESQRIIKQKESENRILISSIAIVCILIIIIYRNYRAKTRVNSLLSRRNKEIEAHQQEIERINEDLVASQGKLKQVNENLESVVASRTSALQRTNEELDTFLYQSSHALRRPIVHIKGLLQLARLEQDGSMLKELFDKMGETAEGMDNMLHKLMVASEISFDGFSKNQIHFEEMVEDVWDALTDDGPGSHIFFELDAEPVKGYQADPVLIRTIFENLLENSIAYLINSKQEQPIIRVRICQKAEDINISIFDNGPGISSESLGHVFKMFMVAHDQAKGYGLGLYIVKKAVEKLNGTINVNSELNQFTEFSITLPFPMASTVS